MTQRWIIEIVIDFTEQSGIRGVKRPFDPNIM